MTAVSILGRVYPLPLYAGLIGRLDSLSEGQPLGGLFLVLRSWFVEASAYKQPQGQHRFSRRFLAAS